MKRNQWLAFAAGVICAVPAGAQSLEQGTWETSIGVAFLNSSDADAKSGGTVSFDSDSGFRAAFDYSVTDALQVGANFGLGTRSYEAAGTVGGNVLRAKGDMDYWTLLVNGTYNFGTGPFKPFVTAGLGWSWIDSNIVNEVNSGCWWDPWYGYICGNFVDTRTFDGLTYQVGVGARYDFSDTLAVHASYRIDWIDINQADGTPDFDGFDLSIGWKF